MLKPVALLNIWWKLCFFSRFFKIWNVQKNIICNFTVAFK